MKRIIIIMVILLITVSANAQVQYEIEDWNQQLFDSVSYSKLDTSKAKLALSNGADTNWMHIDNNKEISVLTHFVRTISMPFYDKELEKGIEVIKLLFQYNAKLQYSDDTILFWPIARGKYEIVKLLLDNGANPTFWPKDAVGINYYFSPIEEATAKGHTKIVDLLINHGAKKLDNKYAAQLRFIEAAAYGTISELKEQLNKGARINTLNSNGNSALINAISIFLRHDDYKKIIFLLDNGADLNLKGNSSFGTTLPLHQAVYVTDIIFNAKSKETGNAEQLLKELIKRGAFISGKDDDGKTPLHVASENNNLYAAKLLINEGSKIMPKDNSNNTPLDYAESAEMIKLLKEHGATEI